MKHLVLSITCIFYFLLNASSSQAKVYYVSSSQGNDSYSPVEANNIATPWKSLARINAAAAANLFIYGDTILFKRNDTFYGTISFSTAKYKYYNLALGAYGSGQDPIISGLKHVAKWQKVKENLWKASCPDVATVSNLYVKNKAMPMGRFPNMFTSHKGYLPILKHDGKKLISTTAKGLDSLNWTGAEAVVRCERWILDRVKISKQEGEVLEFAEPLSYDPHDNSGFFIQNNLLTLDVQNEWYYDKSTRELYFYSLEDPSSLDITLPVQKVLFEFYHAGHVYISDLEFLGAGETAISFNESYQIYIKNLKISRVFNAIDILHSSDIVVQNCNIRHATNNGITVAYCKNAIVSHCSIKTHALMPGHGLGGDMQYLAIHLTGSNHQAHHNTIDSAGYVGIYFEGSDITISRNTISNFCMVKDDGGAIYTFSKAHTNNNRIVIESNIIKNGIGAPEGTSYSTPFAAGIYLDDHASHIQVLNNTISRCGHSGIYIRNADSTLVKNNVVFDNTAQVKVLHDRTPQTHAISGTWITQNIFMAFRFDQDLISIDLREGEVEKMGVMDNNEYIVGSIDSCSFRIITYDEQKIKRQLLDLNSWSKQYKNDRHSTFRVLPFPPVLLHAVRTNDMLASSSAIDPWWGSWSRNGNMKIQSLQWGPVKDSTDVKIYFEKPIVQSEDHIGAIFTPSIKIEKDRQYVLSFSALSSTPHHTLYIKIRQDANSTHTAWEGFVTLDTVSHSYHQAFTANASYDNARIYFEAAEDESTIHLGDVHIASVIYSLPDISQIISVVTNASDSAKKVLIHMTDTVLLDSYSSIIQWHEYDKQEAEKNLAQWDIRNIIAANYDKEANNLRQSAWHHPVSLALFAVALLLVMIFLLIEKPRQLVWVLIPLVLFVINVALTSIGVLSW